METIRDTSRVMIVGILEYSSPIGLETGNNALFLVYVEIVTVPFFSNHPWVWFHWCPMWLSKPTVIKCSINQNTTRSTGDEIIYVAGWEKQMTSFTFLRRFWNVFMVTLALNGCYINSFSMHISERGLYSRI